MEPAPSPVDTLAMLATSPPWTLSPPVTATEWPSVRSTSSNAMLPVVVRSDVNSPAAPSASSVTELEAVATAIVGSSLVPLIVIVTAWLAVSPSSSVTVTV